MKRLVLVLIVVSFARVASAQVIINFAQSRVEFNSIDHDTLVPVGQLGEGTPLITSYQGFTILNAAQPAVGQVISSPVIPRTALTVISGVTPNQVFSLTFAQLGITAATLPACAIISPALCPAYQVVLATTGPAGVSARSALAASDSFALAAQVPPTKPALPSAVKIKAL